MTAAAALRADPSPLPRTGADFACWRLPLPLPLPLELDSLLEDLSLPLLLMTPLEWETKRSANWKNNRQRQEQQQEQQSQHGWSALGDTMDNSGSVLSVPSFALTTCSERRTSLSVRMRRLAVRE